MIHLSNTCMMCYANRMCTEALRLKRSGSNHSMGPHWLDMYLLKKKGRSILLFPFVFSPFRIWKKYVYAQIYIFISGYYRESRYKNLWFETDQPSFLLNVRSIWYQPTWPAATYRQSQWHANYAAPGWPPGRSYGMCVSIEKQVMYSYLSSIELLSK